MINRGKSRHTLSGRTVVALGEHDGISGPVIARCAAMAGATVVYTATLRYVCASAGAMDPEIQAAILRLTEDRPGEAVLVVLGLTDHVGIEMFTRTLRTGDPSYVGPLTEVALGLDVIHVFDERFKQAIPPAVWAEHAANVEELVEAEQLVEAVRSASAASVV